MAESLVSTRETPRDTRDHVRAIANRLLGCLVAVGLAIVACGCTPKADPAVTAQQDFEDEMAEIINADEDTVESLLSSSMETFETLGISAKEAYDVFITHFSYAVDSAKTLSDDEVQLTVTSTNVDVSQITTSFMEGLSSYVDQKIQDGSFDQDSATSELVKILVDKFMAPDAPTVTATTVLDMKRGAGGVWEPSDTQQLMDVLYAGQDMSAYQPES